uniref:medium-chain acyl-CoA ligase n=1 Tax=Aquila chrysaetos chrysaetos TaxID=223781 RepID=A0A663EPC8_AQUCH
MRTFIKSWIPQCLQILRSPCRLFHRCNRLLASQIISYCDSVTRCQKELPEYFNFASDVLDERPANPAFWRVNGEGEEVKWSFEELGFLSRKATVTAVLLRIVFIPGTSQLTAKHILYQLQASKAKCIIANDTLAPAVESVMPDCQFLKSKLTVAKGNRDGWLNVKELFVVTSADHKCVNARSQNPMLIYFTSGSTGSPKMMMQSHSSYGIRFATSGRYCMNLTPLYTVRNTWDTGWVKSAWSSVVSSPGLCNRMIIVISKVAGEVVGLLTLKVEGGCSIKTIHCSFQQLRKLFHLLFLSSYKFMSLKHCVFGGEPLNPEVMVKWKIQTGLDIYEGYGQTETVTACANMKGMEIKPGSLGKAVPLYDVQVCLYVTPELTPLQHKWIMDEERYVWFVGRADDIILLVKCCIGPFEVESALIEHPAVSVVKAFVVLAPAFVSHNPEKLTHELQQHVKKVTAPYKYPRKVEFVQDLPKMATGNIQRKVLRNKEWGIV